MRRSKDRAALIVDPRRRCFIRQNDQEAGRAKTANVDLMLLELEIGGDRCKDGICRVVDAFAEHEDYQSLSQLRFPLHNAGRAINDPSRSRTSNRGPIIARDQLGQDSPFFLAPYARTS